MTASSRLRVLAVEDNSDTQVLLKYLLTRGYDLVIAPRVSEAVAAARDGEFDVFLLDINLGEEETGIDLMGHLRELPGSENAAFIALTAYAMPGDRERFLRNGFDAYVSKPFTRDQLEEAIRSVTRR